MDAPNPFTTISGNNEEKINIIEELNIKSQDKEYILQFGLNDYDQNEMIIKINQINPKEFFYFQNKFSQTDFQNYSKLFSYYDNLKEIIEFLKTLKFEIEKKNDYLIINFKIFLPNGESKLIALNLKRNLIDSKDLINQLLEENKNLKEDIAKNKNEEIEMKKEISNNKKEIFMLKDKIKILMLKIDKLERCYNIIPKAILDNSFESKYQNQINELKNIINIQKKELNELKLKQNMKTPFACEDIKDNKESYYISGIDNSLIINKEDSKLLKEWINPNKNIKAELLYRRTRDSIDGRTTQIFHELCDNKGITLTLFLVEDGTKGGIYTPLSWDYHRFEVEPDMKTFLFNLNKKEKYKKIRKEKSIVGHYNFGPCLPGFQFYDVHRMKKISHYGLKIDEYYERGSQILPNNSSELKLFNVDEVEVYRIIIEN